MPIAKRWSNWSRRKVESERDNYGAYELADSIRNVVYIGSGQVQSRLIDHIAGEDRKPGVSYYRVDYRPSGRRDARARERSLLFDYRNEHGELPRYNDRIPPAL